MDPINFSKTDPTWLEDLNQLRDKIAEATDTVIGDYIYSQRKALGAERDKFNAMDVDVTDAKELTRVINTVHLAVMYAALMNVTKTVSFFELDESERAAAKKAFKVNMLSMIDDTYDEVLKQYDMNNEKCDNPNCPVHGRAKIPNLFKEIMETAKRELASRAAREGRY